MPQLGYVQPATPKATKHPTLCDIAWAAGFLEGEGCFTWKDTECIVAPQVQREPLSRLASLFGGTIRDRHGRGQVEWAVSGSRARGVMMTIYSFMSPRRKEQIKRALSGKKHIKKGN